MLDPRGGRFLFGETMKKTQTLTTLAAALLLLAAPGCDRGRAPEPAGSVVTDSRFHTLDQTIEVPALDAVRYNQGALRIIAEAETQRPDRREQAMLDGLKWIIRLIDSEQALRSISTDALQMLHDLTVPDPESALARASQSVIETSASRMSSDLPWHFPSNVHAKWEFISLIRLLYAHDIPVSPYRDFYHAELPQSDDAYVDIFNNIDFDEALRTANYASMGNFLIYASLLHDLMEEYPESGFDLPEDRFPAYLEQLESFVYSAQPEDGAAYVDQNYFVTHVALMLTKWSELPMPEHALAPAIRSYIDAHYDRVMNESGDLVLFAEFVVVLKLFDPEDDRIEDAQQLLLSYQKPDGSWGADEGVPIDGDAYYAFHPTWAVMVALRHPR